MIQPMNCPICKKRLSAGDSERLPTFPFCSQRCQQVDFFRWFDGKYAITESLEPETLEDELAGGTPPAPPSEDP